MHLAAVAKKHDGLLLAMNKVVAVKHEKHKSMLKLGRTCAGANQQRNPSTLQDSATTTRTCVANLAIGWPLVAPLACWKGLRNVRVHFGHHAATAWA